MRPPLAGIRVVEFEGLGPGPLAGRMLAEMGAEVTVIARPDKGAVSERLGGTARHPLRQGKTVVTLDLKAQAGGAAAMALVAAADAVIEGNRPGVMEKLGLGPADCALLEARASGRGRVVDGAIVDVLAMLGGIAQWIRASSQLDGPAPSPFHDSPFYDVYACADGGFITVGALEPQFYALLLEKLGLTDVVAAAQYDAATWPTLKSRLRALFASRPRAHWCALLEGADACFAPVLSLAEAAAHPHNRARKIYRISAEGQIEASAAPRFLPLSAT